MNFSMCFCMVLGVLNFVAAYRGFVGGKSSADWGMSLVLGLLMFGLFWLERASHLKEKERRAFLDKGRQATEAYRQRERSK